MPSAIDALSTLGLAAVVPPKAKGKIEGVPAPAKVMSTADAWDILKKADAELNKQFTATNSLMRMGSKVYDLIPSISTNCPSLDYGALQCGGIPRGRIIEVYGPESAGKTTECLHIIGQEQRFQTSPFGENKLCAFVDAEHALDVGYASILGVDVDNLAISQPDSGEQALTTVETLIDTGVISLVVVDSVAALVPQAELDGEMGDSNMGLHARLMSQAMRKLRGKANKKGVTVIFINQVREKIGVVYGNPEVTTGGRALKFFASVRIEVRRVTGDAGKIMDGKELIGHWMKLKIVKNKVGAPFRECQLPLLYAAGIDTGTDTVDYAVSKGIVDKAGAWYSYKGERLGQGIENAGQGAKESGLLVKIQQELKELIQAELKAKQEEKAYGDDK
jgi:recombination protein RecA